MSDSSNDVFETQDITIAQFVSIARNISNDEHFAALLHDDEVDADESLHIHAEQVSSD